ncbi:MAG: RNA methyltransferase [Desulfobacteraceae bacterium]|nr:RNA methyltransferase [Desulfobacteraceae bacterium]
MTTPDKKQISAFDKRVKRRIGARAHDFFAVCPPGLKSTCQNELTALDHDIQEIKALPGGVAFQTKLPLACLANISLGSPSKILMRIAAFKAENFATLEKKIKQIDWELFLPGNTELNIQATAHKSRLYHSGAIEERCRAIIEPRLFTPGEKSKQTLLIRADHDQFELSLDMSGDLLFKRGIKQKVITAPLRENLAFAILKTIGFTHRDVLIDPMCGSGTFSIEAAMIQTRIPPGFFRSFAFEHWPGFRKENFNYLKNNIKKEFSLEANPKIFASDIDGSALSLLEDAMDQHDFLKNIQTGKTDFFDIQPAQLTPEKGVVVLNPPYGKRLGADMDMVRFFSEIGKKLAADFKGWRVGIIYPEKALGRVMGLPLQPMPFFHGGLDLFAGIGKIRG